MASDDNILNSCFLKMLKKIWSVPVLCVLLFTLQNVGIAFSSPGDDWENVTIIPRNGREFEIFTQHLNCSQGLKPMYVLHSIRKRTVLGCAKEKLISRDFCPEINSEGVQEKYDAPRKPKDNEKLFYNASDSYMLWDCFESNGGILSPQEREKNIEYFKSMNADLINTSKGLQEDIKILKEKISEQDEATIKLQKENADLKQTNKIISVQSKTDIKYYVVITVIVLLVAIFLLMSLVFIILFLVRKFVYKNEISLGDFRKDTICLLKNCIVQMTMGRETRESGPQITMESEEDDQIMDTVTVRPQNPETVTLDGEGESDTFLPAFGGTRTG